MPLFFLTHCSVLRSRHPTLGFESTSQPYSWRRSGTAVPPRVRASTTPLSILRPHKHVQAIRGLSRDFLAFHARAAVSRNCFAFFSFLFLLMLSQTVEYRKSGSSEKKSFPMVRTKLVGSDSMGFYKKTSSYLFTRISRIDCSSLGECVGWEGLDVLYLHSCQITRRNVGRWRPPPRFSRPTHCDSFTL